MSALLDSKLDPQRLADCALHDALERMADMASVIARATVYRARRGTRPAFATPEEAAEYERGWDLYGSGPCPAEEIAAKAWLQHEKFETARAEERRQQRIDERMARDW